MPQPMTPAPNAQEGLRSVADLLRRGTKALVPAPLPGRGFGDMIIAGLRSSLPGGGSFSEELKQYAQDPMWGDDSVMDDPGLKERDVMAGAGMAAPIRVTNKIGTQAYIDALRKWAEGSKLLDDAGLPIKAYHITPKSFDQFKMGALNRDRKTYLSGPAAWFAPSPDKTHASHNVFNAKIGQKVERTGDYISGSNIMPVHLRMSNPLEIFPGGDQWTARKLAGLPGDSVYLTPQEVEKLRALNIDGVIKYDKDLNPFEYVVLDPTNVKSATGNRGTFSRLDPRITFGLAAGAGTSAAIDALRGEER